MIAERLNLYLQDMRLEKRTLGQILGVRPQTVTDYVQGTAAPTAQGLLRAAESLGVSIDWLLGLSTAARWSPDIQHMRIWLRGVARDVQATGLLERILAIIDLMNCRVGVTKADWFMAGILSISPDEYRNLRSGAEVPLNSLSLARFCDFTSLPEMWMMLGDATYLDSDIDLADYGNVVLRFVELGISADELHQNLNRINQMVQQMRRLSQ